MSNETVSAWLARHVTRAREASAERRAERLAILQTRLVLPVWAWLALIFVLGAAVHIVGYSDSGGLYHPDEIGQYLEPAHRLLERHGAVAWEFKQGARNWAVAWYYGSVLEYARWLGFSGLARLHFVRFNGAIVSLLVIPAAFRIGRTVGGRLESGLLAAALTAILPTLAYYGSSAMAEWHCLIYLSWAYAMWCDQAHRAAARPDMRRAIIVGLLLGGAFVARPNYGVVIPLIAADYVLRRRYRELTALLGGLSVVLAALGIMDWVTWGAPFKSIVGWVNYNIVEGRGATFHVQPFSYYFRNVLFGEYGPALWVILAAMLVSIKVTWRAVLGWFWPILILSMLTNKQDRFLLPIWPCFLAATATSLIETREMIFAKLPRLASIATAKVLVRALPFAVLLLALTTNYSASRRLNWNDKASLLLAQDWVRKQRDLTGLAIYGRWYRSGANMVTDRHIPVVFSQNEPPSARIYSHFIAIDDAAELAEQSPNWKRLKKFGRHRVYRRNDAWIPAPSD